MPLEVLQTTNSGLHACSCCMSSQLIFFFKVRGLSNWVQIRRRSCPCDRHMKVRSHRNRSCRQEAVAMVGKKEIPSGTKQATTTIPAMLPLPSSLLLLLVDTPGGEPPALFCYKQDKLIHIQIYNRARSVMRDFAVSILSTAGVDESVNPIIWRVQHTCISALQCISACSDLLEHTFTHHDLTQFA